MTLEDIQGRAALYRRESRLKLTTGNRELSLELTALILLPGRVEADKAKGKGTGNLDFQAKIAWEVGGMELRAPLEVRQEAVPKPRLIPGEKRFDKGRVLLVPYSLLDKPDILVG